MDQWFVKPDQDSGSFRLKELMRILLQMGKTVTFVPHNTDMLSPYRFELREMGVHVPEPNEVPDLYQFLHKHGSTFDAIIVSRADNAYKNYLMIRELCPQAKFIFDTVDLCHVRAEREYQLYKQPYMLKGALYSKEAESFLVDHCDVTLAISQEEKGILHRLTKKSKRAKVEVISNIHPPYTPYRGTYRGFNQRKDILFVGGFNHVPNQDAVFHFCEHVWPYLSELLPEAHFVIAGSQAQSEIQILDNPKKRIQFLGYVPDLTPVYESVRVCLAPLRYGAGVKGKINQAMNLGVPVVATPIAAEGIPARDQIEILVSQDIDLNPKDFAEKVALVYRNPELWNHLSKNSQENVQFHFGPHQARKVLERIFEESP